MHSQASNFMTVTIFNLRLANADPVLNLGGKQVNDANANYLGIFKHPPVCLDREGGPDVNIVADAAEWEPDQEYDLVICTEVFEHTPRWRDIIHTAYKALGPGGFFLATCARDERPPHSAFDGALVRDGEYYQNLTAAELEDALSEWSDHMVYETDGVYGNDDLYCWAQK